MCLLLLAAPFEGLAPLVRLPWQAISNLEATIGAVLAVWAASVVLARGRVVVPRRIALPWLVMLAVFSVSAALAPADRGNAVHMVLRLAVGLLLATFVASAITDRARLDRVLWTALVTTAFVGLLVILDYIGVAPLESWLKTFRVGLAVVGGDLRASGPFQYPTIAAMFLEVTFALGVGLLLSRVMEGRWVRAGLAFVALCVGAEGITLTFTRAGVVAIVAALIVAAVCIPPGPRRRSGVVALGALTLTVLALFAGSRSGELLRVRLSSEGQEGWYRASFVGPGSVRLPARGAALIDVRVRNDGDVTWDSSADPPFLLSYHWLEAGSTRVVHFDGRRSVFPAPVPPGATATVAAVVDAPPVPGRYQLAWDVVLEHRLWFSTEPGASLARVPAEVVAADNAGPPLLAGLQGRAYPATAVRPGRLTLWRAALGMVAAHPLLGVGLDNFRLQYGAYAGISSADPRVHSNNVYLEWLAGGGLLGALACGWFLWRATRTAMAAARVPGAVPVSAGIAAAWAAVLLHGLVDAFFGFTPTYLVISLTLGLAAAIAAWQDNRHEDPV